MNKKLLATVLASTMVLGSMSAYAATATAPATPDTAEFTDPSDIAGQEIPGVSTVAPVTISVTLPTSLPVLLNPYELDSLGQVVCPEVKILNKGNTAVKATLSKWKVEIENTDVATKPVLIATPPTATSTKKEAFIYLQSDDASGTLPTEYSATKDKLKVVPAKVGETVATVPYGTLPKDSGELKLQFQGKLSTNVAWTTADTIKISPTFKFEPTVVTP